MGLADSLKGRVKEGPAKREPLWRGPQVDGVTQSLLGRFLSCRERFRAHVIEGLAPEDSFNPRLEYGSMWHAAEEGLASNPITESKLAEPVWLQSLVRYAKKLASKYPTAGKQVNHWYRICKVQFPLYVDWWKKHPDVTSRQPLLQEQVFEVPYGLPSGRVVKLRGKWDSVDVVGRAKEAGIYLQENKTKGDIDPVSMRRNLLFDLQTMFYFVALSEVKRLTFHGLQSDTLLKLQIKGVRYNVIRRPLSGGKGSIVQHKPSKSKPQGESDNEFYGRVAEVIATSVEPNGDHHFFMRWRVDIFPNDVERFKRECLDPILEQLCDWYEYQTGQEGRYWSLHYRYPYGVFNPTQEGYASDVEEYVNSGSETGLRRVETLFPELEG